MPARLDLACACGTVRGHVDVDEPARMPRYVCHCDDCQAFIRHLGKTDAILDSHGGTDVVHATPARLTIGTGKDQIGCLELKARGALRWYASCCSTPIGTTPRSRSLPYVSLVTAVLADTPAKRRLGEPRGHLLLAYAYGDTCPLKARALRAHRVIPRILGTIVAERLRGRHRDTPFFNSATGQPIAAPHRLSDDERLRAYDRPLAEA